MDLVDLTYEHCRGDPFGNREAASARAQQLAHVVGRDWDRKIVDDAGAGRLDALANEALGEYSKGKTITSS